MSVFITVPTFPDVPDVPGVPPLRRDPTNPVVDNTDPSGDAPDIQDDPSIGRDGPQWGLFDDGNNLVIGPDSVLGVEFLEEWKISDAPQEDGAFTSYNKVQVPFVIRMTFAKGGTVAERTAFLDDIRVALASTYLYTAITPEAIYKNVNPIHQSYDRRAVKGAGMMSVDVWMELVRVAAPATFSNTKFAAGADPASGGTVQAVQPSTAPTTAQLSPADAK